MSDQDFSELQLRAMIVPEQVRWPAPEYVHWQRLHAAADEARQRLSKARALMDEIDRNADLSREGKERQRRQAAAQAIADFEASKTLTRAREAVTHIVDQWNGKVGLVVKPASNIAEATVHAQIRDRLAAMKDARMGFLESNAADPVVASAILTAPSFVEIFCRKLFAVSREIIERLAQKACRAAGAVVNALSNFGLDHLDHGANERPWSVIFAAVAPRVAHVAKPGLVEIRQFMLLLL
jgi:hypothetical protein